MARQYQKTNWQNTPSTATPLSADNLNHIEDGIYNLETKVENNASAVSDLQSGKVDKVIGKGLSKNDFTDAYKTQIDDNTQDISINKSLIQSNTQSINNLYDIKVNKVTGKGLSTNDFTNNDVDKLRNDTYTKSETRGLVSKAYHPAGTIHVEDLVSSVLVNANLNNVYNLDGDGTTSNLFIEGAGHPLKDGTNIGVINFGTDESPNILFDDLGGFVDLSGYATTSAMNTALADKVDKISGKGLSTNDFTDVYKSQIETNQGNILTLFDDKVDKEAGKGLSSNDFTSRYINAINDNTDNISDNTTAIQANANNITALQNNKVDKVVGKGLSTNDFTNNFKKGIAISQELAYDRATIPQPNLDADFHTVNGERTVIYQGNAYSFHTMTYNPISKKYVYGIKCSPVYQGGLFFCEVDNPASDRHNWLDTTTFPTDILINGDIYTAVMPTGEAYYVSYSYNNNDEKELVYCNALDSSRLDYWIKTEIIINSIFNIGNYIFYVADNKVYKYEFAHGSVELDFDTVPFAYTYGGGRCIALTKNQYNIISAFMSYDGIEWTKVNFPSINKTNKPSGLIYDHGIFLFYQKEDEYVITSKDGFSWEKHKLSINVTEYRENYMIFDEIGWGGGIFYACGNSVDEGHYDDYTIWTSQDGYTWEQTVKYLEDEIDNKTDYYNGTYLISVAQNLYYPTYRLDGVYGKGDVYTKSESDNKYVAKETGKGLSTNDYTTADKNKLADIEAEANKTVVDSFMSDSSTNPLQNKVITKELEGAKTATGNPLTITDAAPVNAVNLSMDLEPIQDLHGYANPWVGGAGKNKLPMTVDGIKSANTSGTWNGNVYTINGVTFEIETDNDGNITNIKVQGTPTSRAQLSLVNGYILNTFKGMILNGTNKDYSGNNGIYVGYSNDGNSWVAEDFQKNNDVTIQNYNYVHLDIMCSSGTFDDDFKPMIRLSTETDSSFAPYTNICPISGRTEEVITQKDNPTNPTVTKTYTIQLGQTVYGAHYDVTKGKMVVDRAEVDLGSLTWGKSSYIDSGFYASLSYRYASDTVMVASSYNYLGTTEAGSRILSSKPNGTLMCYYGTQYAYEEIYIRDDRYTDETTFKTAVTGQQLVYELATPFTIDLTPQQIKMLENTNTISTDYEGDTITLEYQPNNAVGEAVRAVEESYDPEFAVRPVLKKKAFSGTTDSDGAVTLINASDIPSGHKIIPLHITDMTIDGSAGTYFVEYEPYNSGDSVKGYCYFYMSGSQMFPVGKAITGNFYYYDLEG